MNPINQLIMGVVMAMPLCLAACQDEPKPPPKWEIVQEIDQDNWHTSYVQLVKNKQSGKCYLRSAVHGGWSYQLLSADECKQ